MLAMLEGAAVGMATYNPYTYNPYAYNSYTPTYSTGNMDYLLDPNYAIQQTQQQQAQFNAVNQQLINQTVQQVKQQEDEEYMRMTGGRISREEWNSIKAQAAYNDAHGIDNSYGSDYNTNESTYQGKLSPDQYETTYRRYEKLVQDWFNNLTTSGVKGQDSQGNIKGTTTDIMPGGTYITNKQGLLNAQKEMKSIRLEAEKYGVHIQQSKWETATAGY